jgi:aminoglycoside phosphotransferase
MKLETALAEQLGAGVRKLDRRPYPYRTSFPIEELGVVLEDGSAVELLFKDLDRRSLDDAGRAAKPEVLHDPRREIEAYRLLDGEALGTPHFYGAVADGDRFWLFVEKVDGVELWQVGEVEVWQEVARWLARLHARFARRPPTAAPLLRHDAAYYRFWADRARDRGGNQLAPALAVHDTVVERLTSLPSTFIHGELYASNVIVRPGGDIRVAPVDWEMAAIGPGLTDLAALTSGWDTPVRAEIEDAYGVVDASDVDCCRLQLALQWLGWAGDWTPPPEHAHDWLAEALAAAERITS